MVGMVYLSALHGQIYQNKQIDSIKNFFRLLRLVHKYRQTPNSLSVLTLRTLATFRAPHSPVLYYCWGGWSGALHEVGRGAGRDCSAFQGLLFNYDAVLRRWIWMDSLQGSTNPEADISKTPDARLQHIFVYPECWRVRLWTYEKRPL